MYQLEEYTNPRIAKAVEYLYAQVFLVTRCKQVAADEGDQRLVKGFAQIEGMARLAVEEMRLLHEEMALSPVPQAQAEQADGKNTPTPGGM